MKNAENWAAKVLQLFLQDKQHCLVFGPNSAEHFFLKIVVHL